MRAIGERGFSFYRPDQDFRERRHINTYSERERAVWYGGRWRRGYHGGRLGYWWEVNGAWYYYDQPISGPPAYVSDVEMLDDPNLDPYDGTDAPILGGEPVPVEAQPPVPGSVYEPPSLPEMCVGPNCPR
jgi:hypothetical protein